MSATLRVVATPIGNLRDLSPRAIDALATSTIVLAEDTRHTRPLLEHFGVSARLVSCHQHNETERTALVVEHLARGEPVALVSDAGAPGISDPGGRLVDAVRAAGHVVEVFPGPSAVVAALMGAGLVSHRFAFVGFLPKRKKARDALVESVARAGLALVCFEAPSRVQKTLDDLARVLGPRRVVVARELTKRFETFHAGILGEDLTPPLDARGEFVVVVEAQEDDGPSDASLTDDALEKWSADDRPLAARAKELAKELRIPRREAYALLVERGAHVEQSVDDGEEE